MIYKRTKSKNSNSPIKIIQNLKFWINGEIRKQFWGEGYCRMCDNSIALLSNPTPAFESYLRPQEDNQVSRWVRNMYLKCWMIWAVDSCLVMDFENENTFPSFRPNFYWIPDWMTIFTRSSPYLSVFSFWDRRIRNKLSSKLAKALRWPLSSFYCISYQACLKLVKTVRNSLYLF